MFSKSILLPLLTPIIAVALLSACIRPEPKTGTPTPPAATATEIATATTAATATAEATATTEATATAEPTATATAPPEATAVPTSTEVSDEALTQELAGIVAASVGLTTTQPITDALGIAGVQAVKLDNPIDNQAFWLAYTYGLRNFETKQNHLMTIYTRQNGGWQEVARQEFANESQTADDFAPDYLDQNGVRQVMVEPKHIWVEIHGGVGAHSGVYGLYSFDGAQFTKQVTNFTASPGADKLEDLNGDGTLEAVLDATDYYVFCYACGVRYVQHEIKAWDGTKMAPVTLTEIPSTAAGDIGDLNHQLIQLAQRGLWKDAAAFLTQHTPLPTGDATFDWNVIYVRLNAEAKRTEMENSPYPLLAELFYGDLPATVDRLREVGADGIFIANSPLISGTVAQDWDEQMAGYITRTVEPLLDDPINAPLAYFLHGWAAYLQTKDFAAALPDVQKAAALAPDDTLFAKSVDFLTPNQGVAQLTTLVNLNVRSGPTTKAAMIGRLPMNTVAQITGRTPDGQELWWQIVYPAGTDQRGWVSGNPQFSKAENTEQTPVVK